MNAWGLQFADNLVQIAARILPGETVALGQNIKKVFLFMNVVISLFKLFLTSIIVRIIVILVYSLILLNNQIFNDH